MSKMTRAAVAALFLVGATSVVAQNTPQDRAQETTPKGPASQGAVKDDRPTDPNTPKSQSEIEKLKKDEKAGNKSTGG